MNVHDSPIGKIDFVVVKNRFIKKDANFLIFKVKKLYHEHLNEQYIKKLHSDLLKFYKLLYRKKVHFAQIYDLSETETTSMIQDIKFGREYGNFLQENVEQILNSCCSGTSVVVNSEIVKGIVNSALFFYRNVKPTRVHNSRDESFEWLWPLIKADLGI